MMTRTSKRVLLGRVTGAHGIRGDILVRSFTEDPLAIGDYGALSSADGSRRLDLKVRRATSKGVIAQVRGVDNRNDAEALKGVELYVARESFGEAEDGTYFHSDLIGLRVFDLDGNDIGEVAGVENFGAGDLLDVKFSGRKQTEYVAFVEPFVMSVDIDAGRVVVDIVTAGINLGDKGENSAET